MYPLITKILNSNLLELDRYQPGHLFSQIFKILITFINYEPQHMDELTEKNNLIELLRYFIFKIGKKEMITGELVSEIKSVLKQCANTTQFHDYFLKEYAH